MGIWDYISFFLWGGSYQVILLWGFGIIWGLGGFSGHSFVGVWDSGFKGGGVKAFLYSGLGMYIGFRVLIRSFLTQVFRVYLKDHGT